MARTKQVITINVSSEAEVGPAIEAALRQVAQDVMREVADVNYMAILGDQFGLLEKMHADYFAREQTPTGGRWAALSASTVEKKGRSRILVDSGRLLQSLTTSGSGVRRTGASHIEFGTDVPYAMYHLTGFRVRGRRRKTPARPFLGLSQNGVSKIAHSIADAIVARLK